MVRRLVTTAVSALLVCALLSPSAQAGAARPTVTEPPPGTTLLPGDTAFDLASVGYERSEWFLDGTANAYSSAVPLASDGGWTVTSSLPRTYKTRIIVNRPADPSRFNGTVVVEWLNVSGLVDAAPAWLQTHVELIRRGYAWVGVSAQAVGVNQLKCPTLAPPFCPAAGDPARYGSLSHPGDSYSYDMFSQAGQAVLDDPDVLGGLVPERLIGFGESQSASRLVTYIDAVHPLVDVYDGFFVYSRGAAGAALSQGLGLPNAAPVAPTRIRADLDVPVLVFQTETDAGGLQARQPDSDRYRLWEVAGTSHFDQYGLSTGRNDVGEQESVEEWFDFMQHPTNQPNPTFTCNSPINTGPATFVLRAAMAHLNRWITDGTLPPVAPRLDTSGSPYALDPVTGIALGGVRTPAVDVPVAKLSGFGQSGQQFCVLFGTTTPYTTAQLDALYYNHGGFVSRWNRATQDALQGGFIVAEDAQHLRQVAAQSDVP